MHTGRFAFVRGPPSQTSAAREIPDYNLPSSSDEEEDAKRPRRPPPLLRKHAVSPAAAKMHERTQRDAASMPISQMREPVRADASNLHDDRQRLRAILSFDHRLQDVNLRLETTEGGGFVVRLTNVPPGPQPFVRDVLEHLGDRWFSVIGYARTDNGRSSPVVVTVKDADISVRFLPRLAATDEAVPAQVDARTTVDFTKTLLEWLAVNPLQLRPLDETRELRASFENI
jgi:hypothetical protein